LLGFCMAPRKPFHLLWVVIVLCMLVISRGNSAIAVNYGQSLGWRDPSSELFSEDSDYQYVRVFSDSSRRDGRYIKVLALDYLIHGYVDLKDPGHLEYDYELVYRDVARRFMKEHKSVSAFFIGGGSYTFPRWVMHEWPGSTADVAEIDPVVLKANHDQLGLPRNTPIKTMIGDARIVVDDLPEDRRYDLIFGDAFNDLSVPFHLTTLEFAQKLEKHLQPDGVYLLNVIDSYESGLLLGSLVTTLNQAFKHVYVFNTEVKGVRKERDTFVVAASNSPIDTTDWQPGHKGELKGAVLTEENLASLRKKCGGRLITDDDAPVENFLIPVVRVRE
jgi:spermidine synthase